MSIEQCACGETHEVGPIVGAYIESLGPTVVVTTPTGAWAVPRVWIASHGLKAIALPELAAKYDWTPVG